MELKSCPFCGELGLSIIYPGSTVYMFCETCGACGPNLSCVDKTEEQIEQMAHDAWNTRKRRGVLNFMEQKDMREKLIRVIEILANKITDDIDSQTAFEYTQAIENTSRTICSLDNQFGLV